VATYYVYEHFIRSLFPSPFLASFSLRQAILFLLTILSFLGMSFGVDFAS